MFLTRSRQIVDTDELLRKFNKRDEEAFCRVYEKYYNELVFFARKFFVSEGETHAHDVVQDLFVKIWESPKQFESFDMLKSYLYFSLRNKWKNMLEHAEYVRNYAELHQVHPTEEYILASIVESEALALFYELLDTLPPACAQVIRLGLEGLSGQEIADEMHISIHTVYSHKQKAIQLLRSLLPKDMFHLLYFHFLTIFCH